jgi:proteasome accessory factor B
MDNLTRTRHERILAIDRQLRGGKYPNCASFARYWQERFGYEKKLDRRTIMRDIAYLRDMHRAPIEFDFGRNGFYYTDPSWPLPPFLAINELEMMNLLLAWRAVTLYRETPLAESLAGLFGKLAAAVAGEVNLDSRPMESKFSFYASPTRPVDPEVWKAVFDAVRRLRTLDIEYTGAARGVRESRRIRPLHLANIDGEWYVTAFCLMRNDYRHFSLSRICFAKDGGETFEEPDDFDPAAYYAHRFGKYLGSPDETPAKVTVRFTPDAAPWVMEKVWHPEQKAITSRDGSLRLTLPMPSLLEARRWVLSWGEGAEVILPKTLREDVARAASAMVERYEDRAHE